MQQLGSVSLIAKEAGCSASTVSRVLNGCTKGFSVRDELRDRILEIAKRQSFKPNPYLRALKAKRSNLVAILDAPYFTSGVAECAKRYLVGALRKAGLKESLKYATHGNPDSYTVEFPVDAAVIFDVSESSALHYFESNGIPYAVVNGICGPNGVSVTADERSGACAALEHLLSLGHRKIAYANEPGRFRSSFSDVPEDNDFLGQGAPALSHSSVQERESAYLDFMATHALEPILRIGNPGMSPAAYIKAAMDRGATAILCYDHANAMGILNGAWEAGISIPGDLSLVCFNNEFPLWSSSPPLTCIDIPGRSMGLAAAEAVAKMIDGSLKPSGQSMKFEEKLILRKSTASPR